MDEASEQSLRQLAACFPSWNSSKDWYLDVYLPRIVEIGVEALAEFGVVGPSKQRAAISEARRCLSDEEWLRLGEFVAGAVRQNNLEREEEARAAALETERRNDELRQSFVEKRKGELAERESELAEIRELERQEVEAKNAQHRLSLAQEAERADARRELVRRLEGDFLGAESWWSGSGLSDLIKGGELEATTQDFVTNWCTENLGGWTPTAEQVAMICSVDLNTLVAARAGSGKTATMAARAVFLIKHCSVDPGAVLLLAFNTEAAKQLRERIAVHLEPAFLPHVMTFHALAYAIVHPNETLVYDLSESQRPHTRLVQECIDNHLRSPRFGPDVRKTMQQYFRSDWKIVERRGDHLTSSEQMLYRRSLQRESLRGDYIKSQGERIIANILFENDIDYRYERSFTWSGINYRPDFTIFVNGKIVAVLEYFGLAGDDEYDEQMDEKRSFWDGYDGVALIERFPSSLHNSVTFKNALLEELESVGVEHEPLTDEELWSRIRSRALDRFSETVKTLVSRSRQRRWNGDKIRIEWRSFSGAESDDGLDTFIRAGSSILDEYESTLSSKEKEDFAGLMWRAVDVLADGRTTFSRDQDREQGDVARMKFVMIDEFQDFSPMFFELLTQIRSASGNCQLLGVGDNWQGINEFAGSSVEYFDNFEDYFAPSSTLLIGLNRRSTEEIVDIGNALMNGRGEVARASNSKVGQVRLFDRDAFAPTLFESERYTGDDMTPLLLRLIYQHRLAGRDVGVLSRHRRTTPYVELEGKRKKFETFESYGEWVVSMLPKEQQDDVIFSSAHSYKGRENAAIIVIDANRNTYPLLHPSWPLLQVFGDTERSLIEAERRLFYVAASRAETHLDVITRIRESSPFLNELRQTVPLATYNAKALPVSPPPADGTLRVEIRVFDAFAVKDQLKQERFRWDPRAKCWLMTIPEVSFRSELLTERPWFQDGIRLEVRDEMGRIVFAHSGDRYDINRPQF